MKIAAHLLMLGLATAGSAGFAATDPDQNYINVPRDVIPDVADLSRVAKVRFFSSQDQGKSWQLLKELPVADGATAPPHYEFRPAQDGQYLIATILVYKQGTADKDPAPGSIPPRVMHLTVDTIKPVIAPLQAVLDHAGPEQAVIAVSWSANDLNFDEAPVEIAASVDGGVTWPVTIKGVAQGNGKLTVATGKARTVQVRATAVDLAGNSSTTEPVTVALPPPPDPVVELTKAVNQLPTVNEIAATEGPLTARVSASAADHPATAVDPTAPMHAGVPVSTTSASASPAIAAAPAGHPDVIVPDQNPALADPADGGFITGTSIEPAYQARGEQARGEQLHADQAHGEQAPGNPPRSVAQASTDDAEVITPATPASIGPAAPAPLPPDARPASGSTGSETANTAAEAAAAAAPFIPNPAAEVMLAEAQDQIRAGNQAEALVTLRRLHQSGQAAAAITEELALLAEMGDQAGIVATVAGLPPEFVGYAERLAQARALVALKQPEQALGVLARVHAGAPEAREALWLMSVSLRVLRRQVQAHHVL